MKPLVFMGSSLDDLRDFPMEVRKAAGFELYVYSVVSNPATGSPCMP